MTEADPTPEEISDDVYELTIQIMRLLDGQHRTIIMMSLTEVLAHYLLITTRSLSGAAHMAGISSGMLLERLKELDEAGLTEEGSALQ